MGNYTSTTLAHTMEATNADEKVMIASAHFEIPISILQCHLFGKIRSRKRKNNDVLNSNEEKQLVDFVLRMAKIGHPLTLRQLKLKVVEIIQEHETITILQ